MPQIYKNDRQSEFCSLLAEMESAGFTQADISRLLAISRASVSRLAVGEQTPRESTLDLFRRVVAEKLGKKADALHDAPPGHLVDDLVAEFAGLKEKIASVDRAIARLKSAKGADAAKRAARVAAELARKAGSS